MGGSCGEGGRGRDRQRGREKKGRNTSARRKGGEPGSRGNPRHLWLAVQTRGEARRVLPQPHLAEGFFSPLLHASPVLVYGEKENGHSGKGAVFAAAAAVRVRPCHSRYRNAALYKEDREGLAVQLLAPPPRTPPPALRSSPNLQTLWLLMFPLSCRKVAVRGACMRSHASALCSIANSCFLCCAAAAQERPCGDLSTSLSWCGGRGGGGREGLQR